LIKSDKLSRLAYFERVKQGGTLLILNLGEADGFTQIKKGT